MKKVLIFREMELSGPRKLNKTFFILVGDNLTDNN